MAQSTQQTSKVMTVFIGWSQAHSASHAAALALRKMLPKVLPGIDAFMSEADIKPGASWLTELSNAAARANAGVFFITEVNHDSPWMAFESGLLFGKHYKENDTSATIDFKDGKLVFLELQPLPADTRGAFPHLQTWKWHLRSEKLRERVLSLLDDWRIEMEPRRPLTEFIQSFDAEWTEFAGKVKKALAKDRRPKPQGKQKQSGANEDAALRAEPEVLDVGKGIQKLVSVIDQRRSSDVGGEEVTGPFDLFPSEEKQAEQMPDAGGQGSSEFIPQKMLDVVFGNLGGGDKTATYSGPTQK